MDGIQIYVVCLVVFILTSGLVDMIKGRKHGFLILIFTLLIWGPILGRILGLF